MWIGLLGMLVGCTSGQRKVKNAKVAEEPAGCLAENAFPLPQVPLVLTSAEEQEAFLLSHYWDAYAAPDTLNDTDRRVVEQAFVTFADLLKHHASMPETVRSAMGSFCGALLKAGRKAQADLAQLMDECLYNPNSRYYDETLYAVYLEERLATADHADPRRSAWTFKLDLIRRNSVGSRATDFVYYLPDGNRRSLYTTPVRGNRLLLVFYDPECHSCHDILVEMFADCTLNRALTDGRVTVLAVYTEGNSDVWRKYLDGMPATWLIAEDRRAVKDGALYDLKAMPTLYLLDAGRKVLLKDASFAEIRSELGE